MRKPSIPLPAGGCCCWKRYHLRHRHVPCLSKNDMQREFSVWAQGLTMGYEHNFWKTLNDFASAIIWTEFVRGSDSFAGKS